jgi:hypothetical protein
LGILRLAFASPGCPPNRHPQLSVISLVQADVTARETAGVQALKIAAAAAFGALGGVFLLNLHLLIHLIR